MSHYKPYPAYKDSGVEWLGQVPEGWKVKKLKWLASLQSGDFITSESIKDEGKYPVFGGNGLRGFAEGFTHEGRYALIGRQGALCGNINYSAGQFWASEHAVVVSPSERVNTTWLGELLRSMNLNQYSIASAQPGLAVERVTDLYVPVPSLAEQEIISELLDRETTRIDGLVSRKTRFIELLREKRRALITHAVTKGLSGLRHSRAGGNPEGEDTVKMKDSGVEWLGEVPEHWGVCKLSFRYSVELGKMLDEKRITGESLVPYLRNQDVQWNSINIEGLPEMDIHLGEIERYTIKRGDLLVCEGGDVGRAAIWRGSNIQIGYQKALHRLRARSDKSDSAEFFYFSLLAAKERGVFDESDAKATIAHLPAEKFRQYRFAFPPLSEQIEITVYIQANKLRIDTLISKTERSIELLKERRSALITAAVTGQIDLRETI
jgi:type I restriction enzyme S subunit